MTGNIAPEDDGPNTHGHIAHDALAIVVMGVSGCGKSTLGVVLAERLGCRFLEGDDYHLPESVAKMRAGVPLEDADRWPWLDRLGAALDAAAQRDGVAIAACSALKRSYRDRLRALASGRILFLFLNPDRDTLAERMTGRKGHFMPPSLLASQIGTLEPPAEDEPAMVVAADARPELVAAQVAERLHLG